MLESRIEKIIEEDREICRYMEYSRYIKVDVFMQNTISYIRSFSN